MIYLKTQLIDGVYKVSCFNEQGVDITNTFAIKSELNVLSLSGYEKVLEIEGSEGLVNIDTLDNNFIYATVYLDGTVFKTNIKTKVTVNTVVQRYVVNYKIYNQLPSMSNQFLDRFSYFLPKWSTAYKNDVSVYSKVTYPFFSNIEKLYFKTSESVDVSLEGKTLYKKIAKNIKASNIGIVKTEDKELKYTYNTTSTEISSLSKEELHFINLDSETFSDFIVNLNFPIRLKTYCSKIYIRSPLLSTVVVQGIDWLGNYHTEKLTFKTLNVKSLKIAFKTILNVTSSSEDTLVTNKLDCVEDLFFERFQDIPIFSNSDKKVQFPKFVWQDDCIYMNMVTDTTLEYEQNIYDLNGIDVKKLTITKYGEVIGLSERGTLLTGLLNKNIEVNMTLLNNNNNNSYVSVETVDRQLKQVTFNVASPKLYEDMESASVIVELTSNEGTYYLDGYNKRIVDELSHTTLSKYNDLKMTMSYEGLDFISVVVKTTDGSFQASFRNDKITFKEHEGSYQDMFILNDSIVVQDQSGMYFKITPEKDYYEVSEEGYVTLYNPSAKVYTLKGKLINV